MLNRALLLSSYLQSAGWRLIRAQGQHPPRGAEKDEGAIKEVEQAMAGLSFESDSAWDDGSTSVEKDTETYVHAVSFHKFGPTRYARNEYVIFGR